MKLRCMFEIIGDKCHLEKLLSAEKSWYWTCVDYSDGAPKLEKFCVRFKTQEEADKFKEEFAKAHDANFAIAKAKVAGKPQADVEAACIDLKGRPRRPPEALRNALASRLLP